MKYKIIIVILIMALLMQGLVIAFGVAIINDKTAYINGLLSEKAICEGKLDTITQDYEKLVGEINAND